MKSDLHPIEALILAALAVADALLTLMVAVLALLLTIAAAGNTSTTRQQRHAPPAARTVQPRMAGVAAAGPARAPAPAPGAVAPCPEPAPAVSAPAAPLLPMLEALSVDQLRQEARRLGIPRRIVRSLRKADLLPAIAGAAMAPC